MAELLRDLGNPQDRLPPVIHVAGTNGKGSVIAFLRAILEAAGHAVHVYTSPHLVHFNERIRLAGAEIEDAALVALLEECERVNADRPVTFFEITTAAAFLAFARQPADILLLETGLGGRLDATNLVARPALTVITPVSMDHQDFLGDTIDRIAAEKAGILKRGVTCVCAAQLRKAAQVIAERAESLNSPLLREGRDFFVVQQDSGLTYRAGERLRRLPVLGLPGKHQARNAALAIACIDALSGFSIPEVAIEKGLGAVEWPARLQRLSRGPLLDLLPEGWELWVDGGHNPAAGRALAEQGRQWRGKPLHLVVGMMSAKDPIGFLKPLAPRVVRLRAVPIPDASGSLPAKALADAAARLAIASAPAGSVAEALRNLAGADPTPARVLICGSLYLAGTVLRDNG